MNATKMINEKPCKLSNLGQEVIGAKRHNFNTYDNPEKRAVKEREKKKAGARKDIRSEALNYLTAENFKEVLCTYETKLAMEKIEGYEGAPELASLKAYVLASSSQGWEVYNANCKAYNRASRACSKIRYYVRSLEDAQKYLAPKKKDAFQECNGVKGKWALSGSGEFQTGTVDALKGLTRAVQFGNSITVKEREYCLQNLLESIEMLNKHYRFGLSSLAFSFGARGKAGSIAHYQDSQKILAFNRGWIGAFIHELGHAVDYSLQMASRRMPLSIRSRYYKKIHDAGLRGAAKEYYCCEKEIFARLFEVYLRAEIPAMTDFMQVTFDSSVMPELDAESRAWMADVLESSRACHFADEVGL